jgi:hypothetical protein
MVKLLPIMLGKVSPTGKHAIKPTRIGNTKTIV